MHVFGAKGLIGGRQITQEGRGHATWQVPQQKDKEELQGVSGQKAPSLALCGRGTLLPKSGACPALWTEFKYQKNNVYSRQEE